MRLRNNVTENFKKPFFQKSLGFGVLEILVAIAIFGIFFVSAMNLAATQFSVLGENIRATKASYLLGEGMEALRFLRDNGWSANISPLTPDTDYYLNFNGTAWTVTDDPLLIDGLYRRKFRVENVYRDSVTKDIVFSGGALDNDIKKIIMAIEWQGRLATTTTYLANIFD